MDFHPLVLKYKPWSISKANLFAMCARQGSKKYVEKLKEGKKSTQSRVGVSAHALQEVARKTPLDLAQLTGELATIVQRDDLTTAEAAEVRSKLPAIMDYVERVNRFKVQHGVKQEFTEYQIAIDAEGKGSAFFDNDNTLLRGVIDDAMWTQDDILVVVDHKSGRKKPISEHSTQFYAYMAMCVGVFPELKGIQCAVNYFGSPRLEWFPRFDGASGPWTREEIESIVQPWIATYLNKLSKRLQLVDAGEAPAETGWQCDYCGYVDSCQEGRDAIESRKARRGARDGNNL